MNAAIRLIFITLFVFIISACAKEAVIDKELRTIIKKSARC
jgi:hypothetical protein